MNGTPLGRGDVVLVPFPFTDLSAQKLRPALVVGRTLGDGRDVVLAFVTSRIEPADVQAEHLIALEGPEFSMTGLKLPSRIRLDKITTLERRLVGRRLGRIGPRTAHAVAQALRYVFEL